MLRFACANCATVLKYPAERGGCTVACPRCRQVISLPAAARPAERTVLASLALAKLPPLPPPLLPRRPGKEPSSRPALVAILSVAVLLVLLAGVGSAALFALPDAAPEPAPAPVTPEPTPAPAPAPVPVRPAPTPVEAPKSSSEEVGRFTLTAKPHLMACLAQVYGKPSFAGCWVARVSFRNFGGEPLSDYQVRFRLEGFTTGATVCRREKVLPGQTVDDSYFPLLDLERLAELTTPVQADLSIEYEYVLPDGKRVKKTETKRLQVLSRNQVVWSDPRSDELVLASIVTKNDKVIEELGGRISRLAGGGSTSTNKDDAVRFLIALHGFMKQNLKYQTPPGEWIEGRFSQHVKYGRDVLRNKAGTCIDLAILFASVCESVGLKTVLILTKKHCFPGVLLPGGGALLVETTLIGEGHTFAHAIRQGAKQFDELKPGEHHKIDVAALRARGVQNLPLLPANLTLKDLGIEDRPLADSGRTPSDRESSTPSGGSRFPARPGVASLAGEWSCEENLGRGQFVKARMTLAKDGSYRSDVKLFTSGKLTSHWVNKGTYKVGSSTILFKNDKDEEQVCSYLYRSSFLGEVLTITIKSPMETYRLPHQRVPE